MSALDFEALMRQEMEAFCIPTFIYIAHAQKQRFDTFQDIRAEQRISDTNIFISTSMRAITDESSALAAVRPQSCHCRPNSHEHRACSLGLASHTGRTLSLQTKRCVAP
jgi:hypothetical protein